MDRYQKFIEEKAKYKRKLFGAQFHPRTPVLFVDAAKEQSRFSVEELLAGIREIRLNAVILADNADDFKRGGGREECLRFMPPESRAEALKAADFALLTTPEELKEVLRHGCVPVGPATGEETSDYNPLQEKGNGFYFRTPTKWEMFAAVVRARETYQFPYDWENLVREILHAKTA